ncbi:MAG TPA: hypothetical protein PKY77_26190 [Phycisphaerae bacterium]|nr:hypothetical protein [Phycisphaerae bacterium]HRY67693.1 hypothetical protein [Phycisphaerae bacterium]HSA25144.1 hypothetical protein [Phycisphaerae bacterium]
MEFSEDQRRFAEEKVDWLLDQLGPQRLVDEIDRPLSRLLDRFLERVEDECTPARLPEMLAEFVRVAYGEVLPGRRRLSDSSAAAEAIWLLERYYQGGYDAALADAVCEPVCFPHWVLMGLGECVRLHQHFLWDRWVEVRFIRMADWAARCAMAAVLIDRLHEYMPEDLADRIPEQLADSLVPLLQRLLEMGCISPRITFGPAGPSHAAGGHAVQAPSAGWPAPGPHFPR